MSHTHNNWQPDILGAGFEKAHFQLHPDAQGRRITTLIRHLPERDPAAHNYAKSQKDHTTSTASTPHTATAKPRFVFLAIHGWNDYFYQVELARAISAFGGKFYALDLAKYGRSHLPEQMWGYTDDLRSYDDDIHAARDAIYRELPPETPFILYGHSTGGLTAALWAHRHPGALAGLVLNSPWLEIQTATFIRQISRPAMEVISKLDPTTVVINSDDGFYQRSLTGGHLSDPTISAEADPTHDPFFTDGWNPDPRYRHFPSFPARAGWLNAILLGHEQVAAGLSIDAPILTLTATHSYQGGKEWDYERLRTDAVLRVDQIWKRCLQLGNSVTLEKIPNAIHDVTFSRYSARARAFAVIEKWLQAVL